MRPIKLVMQAFGPYRDRETVDFAELGPNRVFLIHGDTGSGKTTILDAIVYALYGDTSGGERRADQMRSESAARDLPTEVVFDFSLGERSYRIRRRPAQELAGKRGTRLVSKQAEVAVWERTGQTASEEGKPLTVKIKEAEALIKDLLGFSCEQFRQVVVLPQGRFRELLSSGSDKREEVLRQLFRTERFRDVEAGLAERAKLVRRDMERLTVERGAQLGLAGAADDAELLTSTERAKAELDVAAKQVADREAAARRAGDALSAGETADEARRAVASARKDVDVLERRADEMAGAQRRLDDGVRANKVAPAAGRLSDAGARLEEARTARAKADQELAGGLEAEQEAAAILAAESGRLREREAAAERVRQLEGLQVGLAAWREASNGEIAAVARVASEKAVAEERELAHQEAQRRAQELRDKVGRGRTAGARLDGARVALERARESEDRCRRLAEAGAAVAESGRQQAALAEAEATALREHERAQAELRSVEQGWKSGRAAALAATLEAGLPCPVCGSTEHPAPASSDVGGVTDEGLEASRSAAALARESYDRAREANAASKEALAVALARKGSILGEVGTGPEVSREDAEAAVVACVAQLEALQQEAELVGLEGDMLDAERNAAEAAGTAREAREALGAAEKDLAAAAARLAERTAAIPEELRAEGALERAVDKARAVKQELEAAMVEAQERVLRAKETRIALQTSADKAAEGHGRVAEHESTCREAFQEALGSNAFATEEEWRQCLLGEADVAAIKKELDTYRDDLLQARGRLQQAEKALAEQAEPGDLERLRRAAEEARQEHSRAIARHSDLRGVLERLTNVGKKLAEIDAESEDIRRAYQTVGLLADVAGGQNPSRVSFQRWVLGVYLDEVLGNAGRRLHAMSKGRYQLERQREAAGRGRPSGLDIAVFDEFSGTSRPAVTLSGGESFLAALALALGLAETVQEQSAGAPLETIFVDEGFGALDPDALELAVDALMDLQVGGRLVGVISHVPELRQVIPARLEVRGGSGGSLTHFVVP